MISKKLALVDKINNLQHLFNKIRYYLDTQSHFAVLFLKHWSIYKITCIHLKISHFFSQTFLKRWAISSVDEHRTFQVQISRTGAKIGRAKQCYCGSGVVVWGKPFWVKPDALLDMISFSPALKLLLGRLTLCVISPSWFVPLSHYYLIRSFWSLRPPPKQIF